MVTGAFWNVSNPTKPWGLFDPNAQLNLPIDWIDWLADAGAAYVSHTVEVDPALEVVSSSHTAGIITILVKAAVPATWIAGAKYAVTCKIVATVSGLTLKDDRTVYLKIVER